MWEDSWSPDSEGRGGSIQRRSKERRKGVLGQEGTGGGPRKAEAEEWVWVGKVTKLTLFYEGDNWGNSQKKGRNFLGSSWEHQLFSFEEMLCKRDLCPFVCWWMQSENFSFLFQWCPWTRACSPFKASLLPEATVQYDQTTSPRFMWLIQVEWCSWQILWTASSGNWTKGWLWVTHYFFCGLSLEP